jgi:hypothetical protein
MELKYNVNYLTGDGPYGPQHVGVPRNNKLLFIVTRAISWIIYCVHIYIITIGAYSTS